MATLELPWAALDAPTSWYRLPSVKVALMASLLLHALAIVLVPNLRVPRPDVPAPLVVELAPPPPPAPRIETPPPPPVVKPAVKPPPVAHTKPLPKPEPAPVVQREAPPPSPQPVVVPPRPVQAEPPVTAPAPPRVEAPPPVPEAPPPTPAPAPRVQQPAAPPSLDTAVLREYGAVVSSAVAKKKVYPRLAMMRHWQGTTDLKLQIAADGGMKGLSVTKSSGFDVLDEQAMKMVKDAMPLPNLPEALKGREFAIDIPVAFRLQD